MHKLEALIPLLGWFYITVFVFALVTWLLRGRFAWLHRVYYFAFGALALVFAGRSLLDEVKLYKISKITLFDSYEQKIANDAGSFYKTYYIDLRSALSLHQSVVLPNVDTREYYYARMYLYPSEVLSSAYGGITLLIVDTSSLKSFHGPYTLVKQSEAKSLIQVEPSPSPSPSPELKGKP